MKNLYQLIKKNKQPLITTTLLGMLVVSYQNCTEEQGFAPMIVSSAAILPPSELPEPSRDPSGDDTPLCADGISSTELICNPLGGTTGSSGGGTTGGTPSTDVPAVPKSQLGLIAKLFEGSKDWSLIDVYEQKGYEHPEKIYFSNFNVPNRSFSEGFNIGENDFLKTKSGEKLVEWFSLSAFGYIVLPDNQDEGTYHISTLSDDGVRVTVGDEMLINSPNAHAAKIMCSSKLIFLKKGEKQKFRLDYFQGPRYHIALMAFIKKVDTAEGFKNATYCNKGTAPSTLINAGYEIISPAYFAIPDYSF